MTLLDRFRQKWKHSDPNVRADAVRELGDGDQEVLSAVAREDSDPSVRRVAIKRLRDPGILTELAAREADEGLRKLAEERASRIYANVAAEQDDPAKARETLERISDPGELVRVACEASQVDVSLAALSRLEDEAPLARVVRGSQHAGVRLDALRRIDNISVVRDVALHDDSEEVALAALERIEAPEDLRKVASKGERKAVRRQAMERLEKMGIDPRGPSKERRAAQLALVNNLEAIQDSWQSDVEAAKVEEARTTWEELGTDAIADLKARFDSALEKFSKSRQTFLEARHRREDTEEAVEAAEPSVPSEKDEEASHPQHRAICERLEKFEGYDEEALTAICEEFEALGPADQDTEQRFLRARRRVEREKDRGKREEQRAALLQELEGRLDDVPARGMKFLRSFEKRWKDLDGPREADPDARQRFDEACGRVRTVCEERERKRQEEAEQNETRLLEVCDTLVAKTKDASHKEVIQSLKRVQDLRSELGPISSKARKRQIRSRIQEVEHHLQQRLAELRDADQWIRWSTAPHRKELCAAIEALVEVDDLRTADRRLRELRAQWNEMMPAIPGKPDELTERFNKAAREVRARCDAHFAQLKGQREENLAKKLELCAQAEAICESTNWAETAEVLKGLQAQWKEIGDVPRKQSRSVWRRFRKACDTFFQHRKEHFDQVDEGRKENLEKKEALCERAEELAKSRDWDAAADALKKLQAQWKTIGPAPRSQADKVWKRFKTACDSFFQNRGRRDEIEREENVERLEAIVVRIEGLLPSPPEDVVSQILDARKEWRAVGPAVPERVEELRGRLDAAIASLYDKNPEPFKGTELDPDVIRKKKEQLVAKVETLKEKSPAAVSRDATLDEMVEQLRAAFQTSSATKADPRQEWRALDKEFQRIRSTWRRLGPVPGESGHDIEARFQQVCDEFESKKKEAGL